MEKRYLNYFYDKAFCINLDKRKDRWEDATQEFNISKISNVVRVSAVDGGDLAKIEGLNPGENGCRLSHLNVLMMAKKQKLDSFLVLEDDVEFTPDFNKKFYKISDQIPNDWDMIYFCSNLCNGTIIQVSENIQKITNGWTSHSIIIKNTVFDYAIKVISETHLPVDVVFGKIQKEFNCYLTVPHLTFQKKGFSDIVQEYVDYSFLKT
jgi:GR25 family glycosyltransferase involved in LPS biosynthesis